MKFIETGRWGAWDFDTPEVLDALNSEWSDFVECDRDGNYMDPVPESVAQALDLYNRTSSSRDSGIITVESDGGTRYFRRER